MNAPSDPQLDSLRIPPHSIEAEQSVIGGLLRDNAAYDRIADFMHAEDFYRYDHRIIFEQIVKMINGSRPADVITVFETLTQLGKADDVGGLAYLNAMAQNTPSAANIRRYAEIVRDRGVLRKLITVADDISGTAFSPQGKEVNQMLDEAESKIFAIAEEGARADAPKRIGARRFRRRLGGGNHLLFLRHQGGGIAHRRQLRAVDGLVDGRAGSQGQEGESEEKGAAHGAGS